jgi:transcriptional regulator with XRE-family HTH domain
MKNKTFDVDAMRQRIRDKLKEQRLTQGEAAERAGLGHGYLTNILTRDQMPSVEKLHALCQELDVSIAWMMYGTEVPEDFDRVAEIMNRDPRKFYALLALLE